MKVARNEAKYQMIKLVRSGRTLGEAKAIMKAGSVGLTSEYAKEGDLKDLQSLEGGLYRIGQTRKQAQGLLKVRFAPRKMNSTREEHLAKWASGYKGKIPLNWKRDGNLIRRGPPNKPRPGSSAGKIGRTRVIGATKGAKRFQATDQDSSRFDAKARKERHEEASEGFQICENFHYSKGINENEKGNVKLSLFLLAV